MLVVVVSVVVAPSAIIVQDETGNCLGLSARCSLDLCGADLCELADSKVSRDLLEVVSV